MKIQLPKLARKGANRSLRPPPLDKLLVVIAVLGPRAIYECHHPKELIMGMDKDMCLRIFARYYIIRKWIQLNVQTGNPGHLQAIKNHVLNVIPWKMQRPRQTD